MTLPGTGGTVTFKYDPAGRRIYKSSSSGASIYIYDVDNLVEETNSSGTSVARYAQGLTIDEPLAMLRSSTTSYYQADGSGSITSLTNGSGTIAQSYGFDSFGNLTTSSGSLTNPFRYAAREFDGETSLYYYRARYYDPTAGRFLSEDPARFPAGVNFYGYVGNRPLNFRDPSGLCPARNKACEGITPPGGPIDYAASAQANAQRGLWDWYQAFKGGGTQDFKGNNAFGNRQNQVAVGNFNFGASVAAKGGSLNTAQALAGAGALLSNLTSQVTYAVAQSADMQGQYGGPSSPNPGAGAPPWNMGPGFPGFPVMASNGILTQGDQVAPNENAAVVAGYMWYARGCYK